MKKIKNWGIQSKVAKLSGIAQSTVHNISACKVRATVEQAEILEGVFKDLEIPIDRMELLYGDGARVREYMTFDKRVNCL